MNGDDEDFEADLLPGAARARAMEDQDAGDRFEEDLLPAVQERMRGRAERRNRWLDALFARIADDMDG